MAIVNVFCCRANGRRKYKDKEAGADALPQDQAHEHFVGFATVAVPICHFSSKVFKATHTRQKALGNTNMVDTNADNAAKELWESLRAGPVEDIVPHLPRLLTSDPDLADDVMHHVVVRRPLWSDFRALLGQLPPEAFDFVVCREVLDSLRRFYPAPAVLGLLFDRWKTATLENVLELVRMYEHPAELASVLGILKSHPTMTEESRKVIAAVCNVIEPHNPSGSLVPLGGVMKSVLLTFDPYDTTHQDDNTFVIKQGLHVHMAWDTYAAISAATTDATDATTDATATATDDTVIKLWLMLCKLDQSIGGNVQLRLMVWGGDDDVTPAAERWFVFEGVDPQQWQTPGNATHTFGDSPSHVARVLNNRPRRMRLDLFHGAHSVLDPAAPRLNA